MKKHELVAVLRRIEEERRRMIKVVQGLRTYGNLLEELEEEAAAMSFAIKIIDNMEDEQWT